MSLLLAWLLPVFPCFLRISMLVAGTALENDSAREFVYGGGPTLYELHYVIVTVEDTPRAPNPPEHLVERARLLDRLKETNGKSDAHHPRYRLLQALHGFRNYKQTQMAELHRWKGLYKHVPKRQRQVSRPMLN